MLSSISSYGLHVLSLGMQLSYRRFRYCILLICAITIQESLSHFILSPRVELVYHLILCFYVYLMHGHFVCQINLSPIYIIVTSLSYATSNASLKVWYIHGLPSIYPSKNQCSFKKFNNSVDLSYATSNASLKVMDYKLKKNEQCY